MAKGKKPKTFIQFLDKRNVISNASAFAIGLATSRFFQEFLDSVIVPVINRLTNMKNLTLQVGESLTIKYGSVLTEFINLVVILYMSYAIMRGANSYLGWS